MKEADKISTSKVLDNKTKQETWEQSTKNGDTTECIRVEKLYNQGYLVTLSKYGYKGTDSKREYYDVTRKLYSETNPLDKDESDDPFTSIFKTLGKDNK